MFKIEGFYIWVDNLDKAIDFYEKIFKKKISHREKDRWADFGEIGLYNYTIDGEKVEKVDASVPIQYGTVKNVLKSFDVKQAKITGTLSASGYSNSTITLTIVVDNTP